MQKVMILIIKVGGLDEEVVETEVVMVVVPDEVDVEVAAKVVAEVAEAISNATICISKTKHIISIMMKAMIIMVFLKMIMIITPISLIIQMYDVTLDDLSVSN